MPPVTRAAAAAEAADLGKTAAASAAHLRPRSPARLMSAAVAAETADLGKTAASSADHLRPRSRAPRTALAPSSASIDPDDVGRSYAETDLRGKTTGKGKDDLAIKTTKDWIKIGKEFANDFYLKLRSEPKNLHMLYHHTCDVSWNIHDKSYTMKSQKDVRNVMATQTIQHGNFCLDNHIIQENNHSLHVVVYGVFILESTSSNFFQSFVLHRHKCFILNDTLVVGFDVPQQLNVKRDLRLAAKTATKVPQQLKIKIKTDTTRAAEVAAKDAEVAALGSSEKPEVVIIYNKECLQHVPPHAHKENPRRIKNIIDALKRDGVFDRVLFLESVSANRKQMLAVHDDKFLKEVFEKLPLSDKEKETCLYISREDGDMYSSDGTQQAVRLAAGAVIKACHSVAKRDFKKSFALVRPPGHHARADFAEGFCYLNNAAIGVKYLQEELGLKKIMVVDFDVHHGNGTQSIFYDDDSVMVFSMHCKTIYPLEEFAKGYKSIGNGKGRGYNINVPLKAGYGNADVLYVFDHLLEPLVSMFKPQMIVVSAGYDAAIRDPLGQCKLTRGCFGAMTTKLVQYGGGYLVMVLEGGYGPSLGDCVSNTLKGLLGDEDAGLNDEELRSLGCPREDTIDAVRMLKDHLNGQVDGYKI